MVEDDELPPVVILLASLSSLVLLPCLVDEPTRRCLLCEESATDEIGMLLAPSKHVCSPPWLCRPVPHPAIDHYGSAIDCHTK